VKLGFSSLAAIDRPLADLAAMLARAGYDGIELRGKDRRHVDAAMSAAERKEVVRILADAGLEAAAVTSYMVVAEDSADAAAAGAVLRSYLDLARDLGSPMLRVFGGRVAEGENRADIERRMADLLLSVADEAQARGVCICLETHDSFTRAAAVARVLALADQHAVAALWDVLNQFQTGEPPLEALRLLWPRIGYLHVKDGFTLSDGRHQLCLLGAGELPVRAILAALKQRGFGGYLVVEWEKAWHPELADADIAAPQHIMKLREYLAG